MNFIKIGHSGIVPFAYVGKEEMFKYMQYEANKAISPDQSPGTY